MRRNIHPQEGGCVFYAKLATTAISQQGSQPLKQMPRAKGGHFVYFSDKKEACLLKKPSSNHILENLNPTIK